jgi:serine/threonine-protein kinase
MRLPAAEQQAVSDALARYQRSPAAAAQAFGVRNHFGPANAPVKFVEFTDIRCGHCAQLIQVMKQIERVVPEGRIAIEARNFPLDHTCNSALQGSDETGLRCLGAKLQICLEGTPDFWPLREKLYEEQESLTPERALQIASSGSLRRAALEECVASSKTAQLLKEDIDYAMRYSPQGTPLILINEREAMFVPSFLLAMAMTGGNPRSPAFEGLPPPHASLP